MEYCIDFDSKHMFHFFSAQELANIALKRADMLAQKYGKLNYHIGGKFNLYFLFSDMDFQIAQYEYQNFNLNSIMF